MIPLVPLRMAVRQVGLRYQSAAAMAMNGILHDTLDAIREAGTYKSERIITTKQASKIQVAGSNREILNFCANNYLGLSSHPEVVEAARKSLDKYGAGLSSVRFICGTQDIHKELEEKIARFHGREAAILYASCFDANAGVFESLLTPEDAVISDELNHASIIDGIRLCKAQRHRYKHMDMEDLERLLAETSQARMRLIVTDSVFSMDGDIAPLTDIIGLADKHNALIFLDECHATGFMGASGRGVEEHLGLGNRCDIINSTLGKALGGASGGYTTGPQSLIDMLRQKSRPYLFSNSLPPPVVATALKVFDIITADNSLIAKLAANTKRFRTKMTEAGFTLAGSDHPISPVMLKEASLAARFADEMLKRDIYVIGFSYPVVPQGKARIRVQLSAQHTEEEVDQCIDAFTAVGRELGVIS